MDARARHRLDDPDQRLRQLRLIRPHRGHALLEFQPATRKARFLPRRFLFRPEFLSQPLEIFQRAQHTCDPFVVLGAGLELVRQFIRSRADLVRLQLVQQVIFPIQRRRMRTEKLITTAHEKITADILHVDGTVRRVLHRVDVNQRAGLVRHLRQLFDRVHRPQQVRGIPERRDLRFLLQRPREIIQVERALLHVNVHPEQVASPCPPRPASTARCWRRGRGESPAGCRRVARSAPATATCAGSAWSCCCRRRSRSGREAFRKSAIAACGFVKDLVRTAAGLELSLVVGVALEQIAVDAFKAGLGDLRPGGVIQKDRRAVEGRELLADKVQVRVSFLPLCGLIFAISSALANSSGVFTFQNASPCGPNDLTSSADNSTTLTCGNQAMTFHKSAFDGRFDGGKTGLAAVDGMERLVAPVWFVR
ncbi:MAG: hypothetical protein MZV64_00545 [Ignavibacteriales bacterium]|nr:hypothetical protein [Ignavibacteriales bacterium]